MVLITGLAAIAAVLAHILLAVCTKRPEEVVYGKLDKAGRITNLLLIPIYAGTSVYCMALSIFCNPAYDGLLGVLGWVVSILIAAAPLYCGLSLGFSTALRKKGKSKLSFWVQFAGFIGCILSFLLFVIFYGNLLKSLN